jgi:carbonic anhydrase
MINRRRFITSVSLAGAAGGLAAISSNVLAADFPAMTRASQQAMTPDQALAELKAGNERFVSGDMHNRDLVAQVKETSTGQFPFAVILGCIDSRVPPELVFDQGIGDMFSPRIAGNFANADIIGSIEFATKLAGAKLIVVLGHTECGAVKGACDGAMLGNLTTTLSKIAPAVYAVQDVKGARTSSNPEFVQKVADENVRLTTIVLQQRSFVLNELVKSNQLKIVGAMHDVSTGRIEFFS